MAMFDCPGCGEPVLDDAQICPHCGFAMNQPTVPRWFQIAIAVVSVGVAYWVYDLLSTGHLSPIGAVAGLVLYAGAVWLLMKALFKKTPQ